MTDRPEKARSEPFVALVEDAATFAALIADAMSTLLPADASPAYVVFDSATAHAVGSPRSWLRPDDQTYVFGPVPRDWPSFANVFEVRERPDGLEYERFAFLLGGSAAFAAFSRGARTPRANWGDAGWTTHGPTVRQLAAPYLSAVGVAAPERAEDAEARAREADCLHMVELNNRRTRRLKHIGRRAEQERQDILAVLDILKAVSSRRRSRDVLFVFVEQIAASISVRRCSVVRVWGGRGSGSVLASHDDERVTDLEIDLSRYPELVMAIDTGRKVIVNHVAGDPIMAGCTEELARAGVHSILVVPIVVDDPEVGTLVLRAARGDRPFSRREIGFCEIVAEAAAHALERAHLLERIQSANEDLERQATTDALTDLHNRRYFRSRIEDEFGRAGRYGSPLSLLLLDIDNFKTINDTHGHLQGDRVLREVASRIQEGTRKIDVVARYGGEEFAVLLPQTGAEGALAEAGRLLELVRAGHYPGMPASATVTVSIGAAALDHSTMPGCEDLVRAADDALYEAKRQGKDRVVLAE